MTKTAKRLLKYDQLILICGRYEGVDERVAEYIADEEISLGDYVLSGGELAAMIVVDAVSRQIPGVLGKHESLEEIKGSYPVYTKPEVFIVASGKRSASSKTANRSGRATGKRLHGVFLRCS
jgi:tRNA-(guanine-N1)-methyltransferase